MVKYVFYICLVAIVSNIRAEPIPEAKPGVIAASFAAPLFAPAVVTAQSSQVIARNYNTLAAPLVAAAAPVLRAAPLVAAPVGPVAYQHAPLLSAAGPYYTAPYVAGGYYGGYSAYSAPLVL